MCNLKSKDLTTFNRAVLALHSARTATEFPALIHNAIEMTISGEIAYVDWIDTHTSRSLACHYSDPHITPELNALLQLKIPTELPKWLHGLNEAISISSTLTRTEWFRKDILWAVRSAVSLEEPMYFEVRLSPSRVAVIGNIRSRFGTYKAEDRLKLKLLGSHVQQIYRRLAAQGEVEMARGKTVRLAQARISMDRRKCEWSDEARIMLKDYRVAVVNDLLPDMVDDWFLQQSRGMANSVKMASGISPLVLRREGYALSLFLTPSPDRQAYWLILEEKDCSGNMKSLYPNLSITPRESEVLFWAAEGKSNSEIAIILGIGSRTVGRHLENIFPKLGVENRYAASLIARTGWPLKN